MADVDLWMPLYIGDYIASTSRLTTEQHGAYLLILMDYWKNGPPPNDDHVLAQIARLPVERWQAGVKQALSKHFEVVDGEWIHGRVESEKESAQARRRRSMSGAASRWGEETAEQRGKKTRSQRLKEAREKGTHTTAQWEAMKDFHGHACVRCGDDGEMVKDHITPIYQGGSDGIENIQPLCRSCNAAKGAESTDLRKDGWQNACQTPANGVANDCTSPSPSPSPNKPTTVTNYGADKPRKRAAQLPENFEPNETNKRLAEELNVSLITELPQFCDHHRAKGSTMKDWHAALNTWIRNAKRFDRGPGKKPAQETPRERAERMARDRGIIQ